MAQVWKVLGVLVEVERTMSHELEPLPGGGVQEICRIDPGACNLR